MGTVRRLIFKEERRKLRGVFSLMREVRAPFSQKIILHNIELGRPPIFFPSSSPEEREKNFENTHDWAWLKGLWRGGGGVTTKDERD